MEHCILLPVTPIFYTLYKFTFIVQFKTISIFQFNYILLSAYGCIRSVAECPRKNE